jgi:hypothetical protein
MLHLQNILNTEDQSTERYRKAQKIFASLVVQERRKRLLQEGLNTYATPIKRQEGAKLKLTEVVKRALSFQVYYQSFKSVLP